MSANGLTTLCSVAIILSKLIPESRLVVNVFKADTHLAIICRQRPRLLDDELDTSLPSTFALRNCHGLDVFFRRRSREPVDRSQLKISWVTRLPDKLKINIQWLVEDIHVGLCGLVFDTLRQSQIRAVERVIWEDPSAGFPDALLQRISYWNRHLGAVVNVCHPTSVSSVDHEADSVQLQFLAAYLGEEDETDQASDWMSRVQARAGDLVHEAVILYHLIHMLMSTDELRIISDLAADWIALETPDYTLNPGLQGESFQIGQWAKSIQGRAVLFHALTTLQVNETMLTREKASNSFPDPIVYAATSLGALVFWGWLSHVEPSCQCTAGLIPVNLELDPRGVKDHTISNSWIQYGGPASYQGIPLCKCHMSVWINRFAATLPKTKWDMAGIIAPTLKLHEQV